MVGFGGDFHLLLDLLSFVYSTCAMSKGRKKNNEEKPHTFDLPKDFVIPSPLTEVKRHPFLLFTSFHRWNSQALALSFPCMGSRHPLPDPFFPLAPAPPTLGALLEAVPSLPPLPSTPAPPQRIFRHRRHAWALRIENWESKITLLSSKHGKTVLRGWQAFWGAGGQESCLQSSTTLLLHLHAAETQQTWGTSSFFPFLLKWF